MADFYDLPFNDILNWRKFSLVLRERDYGILKKVLQGVTRKEYRILHAGVRQVRFVK
jgi:ACT domain-containing protein